MEQALRSTMTDSTRGLEACIGEVEDKLDTKPVSPHWLSLNAALGRTASP